MTSRLETLRQELAVVGYFPTLAMDVLELALAGQVPQAFLVVPESALGHGTIGWHLTVLALTDDRLVVAHVDDTVDEGGQTHAAATTTSVKVRDIRQVRVTHLVDNPADYRPATTERTMTVAIGWGTHRVVDLEAAECPDPDCVADHGYQGNTLGEDITFTISNELNGSDTVDQAMAFLRHLWMVQGRSG